MAIYTDVLTGGVNNHETTAQAINGAATDFIGEGIVNSITATGGVAPMTGGYSVAQQSPLAMAVDVSTGVGYVTATPTGQSSQNLRVRNTATVAVVISANSSGSTKYDWLYIKVDPDDAADPGVNGDDVATLVTSRSTSSVTDDGTPPTYSTLVAVVTVANGAASIANASIADRRTQISVTIPDNSITQAKIVDANVSSEKLDLTIGARAYRNAAVSYSAEADIVFDVENWDLGSDFSTSTGRFTAPVTGYYDVTCQVRITDLGDTNTANLRLYGNSVQVSLATVVGASAGGDPSLSATDTIYLTATQEIKATMNISTSKALNVGSTACYIVINYRGL